jgi:hypothetical protein
LIIIQVDGLLDAGSGLRLGVRGGGGGHGGGLLGRARAEAGESSGEDTASAGELLSGCDGSGHGKVIVISLVLLQNGRHDKGGIITRFWIFR